MTSALATFLSTCGIALAAILNSLWQTVALTLVVWTALRCLARIHVRINAATRCAVWWGVLAAIVILPMTPQPSAVPLHPTFAPAMPDAGPPAAEAVILSAPETMPTSSAVIWPLKITGGSWFVLIVGLWSSLSLYRMAQLGRSYRYLRGIKGRGRAVSPEHSAHFNHWAQTCNIARPVQLLVSSEIISPMAVGFRRPAVMVPETLLNEFSPEELDHVFLHELAHIARRDDWTNLFARLIGALLPVHPVAAWVLQRIEQDREIACDDWVVAMTGDARPYAASLTRLFELCSARRRQLLATGMADRASHLGERIEALLRSGREFAPRVSLTGVALGALLLVGFVFIGAQAPHWIAFAQETPAAPQPPVVPLLPVQSVPAVVPIPPVLPIPPATSLPELSPPSVEPPAPPDLTNQRRDLEQLRRRLQEQSLLYSENHPKILDIQAQIRALEQEIPKRQAIRQEVQNQIQAAQHAAQQAAEKAVQAARQAQQRALEAHDQLARQGQPGASGSFLAALAAAGYGNLSVDEIIEARQSGATPDLIRTLKEAFPQITLPEILEAAKSGLKAESVRQAREYRPNLTLEQIIRLRQAGVI